MKDACDACGALGPRYEGPNGTEYCDVCAHVEHGEGVGERYAAAKMFMVTAQAARCAGIKGADLHALLAEALEDDQLVDADVPAFSSMGEMDRRDRRWLRPLEGEAAEAETGALMDKLEASINRSKGAS